MERAVEGVCYTVTRKKVKNLNLRVTREGAVHVSAPRRVPLQEIDRFVLSHKEWISRARRRMAAQAGPGIDQLYTDEECLKIFASICSRWYPCFAAVLPQKPEIRVKEMRSRWGVCHPAKGYITLNRRLIGYPEPVIEYVVLHELVHFLHPDHQAGFHAEMAKWMPDYKERRARLREGGYG